MKDRKPSRKPGSVDELIRSVYDSLSVKVLAEAAADAPPASIDAGLDEIEARIERLEPAATPLPRPRTPRAASRKRARS